MAPYTEATTKTKKTKFVLKRIAKAVAKAKPPPFTGRQSIGGWIRTAMDNDRTWHGHLRTKKDGFKVTDVKHRGGASVSKATGRIERQNGQGKEAHEMPLGDMEDIDSSLVDADLEQYMLPDSAESVVTDSE